MDYSPPGFSIHAVFEARVLEWVAISFSNDTKERFVGSKSLEGREERSQNAGDQLSIWWEQGTTVS